MEMTTLKDCGETSRSTYERGEGTAVIGWVVVVRMVEGWVTVTVNKGSSYI